MGDANKPGKLKGEEFRYDSFQNGEVLFNKKKNRLPAMGWNSWNAFGSGNTEKLTKEMADCIKDLGLDKLGYEYVVLDDGCYKPERIDGKLSNEENKFPSGFRALADYIHQKGLKFGMYNDIGTNLCAGAAVGTFGHEAVDAASYLDWGVDFIKVDNCYYMWDNATFSNPENARFTYAPRIKGIKLIAADGTEDCFGISVASAEGEGVIISEEYAENIGTFDGTNTGTSPNGVRSGELIFTVQADEDADLDLVAEYATGRNASGQEAGVGEWLQIAIDTYVDIYTCDTIKKPCKIKDLSVHKLKDDNDTRVACSNSENKATVIKSELYYDDLLPATDSKDTFIESERIGIKLKKGVNRIRLMNHRRQENTLNSYAELLKGFNELKPDNDIVLSICEWGKTQPQNWGYKTGDSWRILNDITFRVGRDGDPGIGRWFDPGTPSITSQYNKAVVMGDFSGLDKGWNDPDMLMIGMDGLTDIMCKTHMTMWCMMNSPLMLGLDLRRVRKDDWIYRIIANAKMIALNQDSLGIQARRIFTTIPCDDPAGDYITNHNRVDILAKPLSDGSVAISFINVSEIRQVSGWSVSVDDIPFESFKKSGKYEVKDLWTGEVSVNDTGVFKVDALDACDNVTIRVKAL